MGDMPTRVRLQHADGHTEEINLDDVITTTVRVNGKMF